MKKIKYIIISVIFLFSGISILFAQNTDGKEFWLTFGLDRGAQNLNQYGVDFQIRIVGGNLPATVSVYFTNLDETMNFPIAAYEVFTYSLTYEQRVAVYNTEMGISNKSVHITSNVSVSVYAFQTIYGGGYCDATNLLPVETLGTEYYQISYTPVFTNFDDAYAIVATQNNTLLYHDGIPMPEGVLNAGEVYYRTSTTDMTGAHITSNHPVAFFALHIGADIPSVYPLFYQLNAKHLIQQLAPVNTWDRTFFVPVTVTASANQIVRIVVSQNNTTITKTGGTIRTGVPEAQTTLLDLQAGQFVELEIPLPSNGCFIYADKPVGICAYMTTPSSGFYYPNQMPAQTWIPGIKETVDKPKISPFNYLGSGLHFALIFTPKSTKNNTQVSIDGASFEDLTGGSWIDNPDADMSFYNMPLDNENGYYIFSNPEGMVIWGYGMGIGILSSYFYLAYSAMRDLQAAFYANDIHCGDLENNQICEKEVNFRAEIENIGVEVDSIKWYINGVEFEPAQNQETWDYTFTQVGVYEITMEVYYFENGETKTKTITGTLKRKDLWVKMRNVKH